MRRTPRTKIMPSRTRKHTNDMPEIRVLILSILYFKHHIRYLVAQGPRTQSLPGGSLRQCQSLGMSWVGEQWFPQGWELEIDKRYHCWYRNVGVPLAKLMKTENWIDLWTKHFYTNTQILWDKKTDITLRLVLRLKKLTTIENLYCVVANSLTPIVPNSRSAYLS